MTVRKKYPMVGLVVHIIGLLDPYGVNHSERVAMLCLQIGARLHLNAEDLEILELSALLHDIGKLCIPEATRGKPGPLLEAERIMMQQHTVFGLQLAERLNGSISPRVHQAIYCHHEDYGGTGYPEGRKGEAIPLEARIIRIADTYDAMTHARGFSLPKSSSSAIQEMVQDQEQKLLFDPEIFRLFLELMLE